MHSPLAATPLLERVIRHAMNRNVARIRASKW